MTQRAPRASTTKALRTLLRGDENLLVGESAEMAAVIEQVEEAAANDSPVLIEGEPGTGRELVARTIHYAGPRRGADFVALKATTIPRRLLEGELFGARSGTLRRAHGGTLLVKDVDALPAGPQRGLARVLKRRRDDPPPAAGEHFDVRIIGASDGDLHESVAASFFDRELYERMVTRIRLPPLRRRLADLPKLVRRFLAQAGEELGRARPRISDAALERMAKYPWPGNVAELKDVARRLVLAQKDRKSAIDATTVSGVLPKVAERIPVEDMSFEELVRGKLSGFLRRVDGYPVENLYDDVIARVERPLLQLVMEHAGDNQLRAAQILGLNRNTLRAKLARYQKADEAPPARRKRN